MRGYLSILDKLPNRLTGSVNNLLGVPPCEFQALSNAGGIPLELLVLLLTSAVSGPVLSIGVVLVSFFLLVLFCHSLGYSVFFFLRDFHFVMMESLWNYFVSGSVKMVEIVLILINFQTSSPYLIRQSLSPSCIQLFRLGSVSCP